MNLIQRNFQVYIFIYSIFLSKFFQDIFDYITYDIIHNQKALEKLDLYHLFEKSEKMAR